jgi:beta-phosphoglucomutase
MVRAIVFDLDGTLADTEGLHFEAFNEVLRPYGFKIARDDYFSRLIGYNDHDCFTLLLRERRAPIDSSQISRLTAHKTSIYKAMLSQREVLFPGALEFVRQCAGRFPLALVTGTLRAEAEMILRRAKIRELFTDIVAAEDVERGKPAPDGFDAALSRLACVFQPRLSLVAAECLAIEDTVAGIEAAKQAGMRVLAVAQTVPASELGVADLVRPSLAETDLDEVVCSLAALD